MALAPGSRLGAYEVLAQIGEGGMGEVYRARDSRLNRDVALKILPDAFAGDSDRLARFTREAQTLASLNHPNIAAIYGIEAPSAGSGQAHALVMELVEGADLSVHIKRGPIPLAELLPMARQVAEALDAAHEQGIIHRDLKPANIKVRTDGTVKVLDFGLAKAMDPAGASSAGNAANSPTLTALGTQMGMILGTAAYMAPEQARGKTVDKRADIWAFGVVVYEMVTGQRAFKGEEVSDVLAAVLRQDIDWTALPADTPLRLRRLLDRCLDRDPKTRLRDIGEAHVEISKIERGDRESTSAIAGPAARPTPWLAWTVAAVSTLALVALALWASVGRNEPAAQLLRLTIPTEAGNQASYAQHSMGSLALSPSGSVLVFRAGPVGGATQLYQRRLDQLEASLISGTENAYAPLFSPDGDSVAFAVPGSLKKVSIRGGVPLPICPLPTLLRGGSWGDDGFIYFAGGAGGSIQRVSAEGGTPESVTESGSNERHRWPQVLPGAKSILYTSWTDAGLDSGTIVVESLSTHERQIIARGGWDGRYVSSGHVIYARPEGLMAVPFDLGTLKTTGPARPTGERVALNAATGHARYAVSTNGVLVYEPGTTGAADASLVWVDRKRGDRPVRPERDRYQAVRLSPDGKLVAVVIADPNGSEQIWVLNPDRGTIEKRTFEGSSQWPVWTPDSKRLTYMSTRADGTSNVYWRAADGSGSEERLTTEKGRVQYPNSWSGDKKVLTLEEVGGGLSYLTMDGGKAVRHEILQSGWNKDEPRISWDGKWLAYSSFENGPNEIIVQPFPALDAKYMISAGGGRAPRWSRDGRQLFYWAPPGKIMTVSAIPGSSISWSKPTVLFEGEYVFDYDVSADGNRFLMIKASAQSRAPSHFNVVVNWFQELTEKK